GGAVLRVLPARLLAAEDGAVAAAQLQVVDLRRAQEERRALRALRPGAQPLQRFGQLRLVLLLLEEDLQAQERLALVAPEQQRTAEELLGAAVGLEAISRQLRRLVEQRRAFRRRDLAGARVVELDQLFDAPRLLETG